MIYKRFITHTLWVTISILSIIASFNYIMDPAGLFVDEIFYLQLAEEMIKGKTIAIYNNMNEAIIQTCMAKKIPNKDVIVLGSSRIMGVNSVSVSNNLSLYNMSVSSANLEDDIALWELYLEYHEKRPEYVIIGLDSNLLNSNAKRGKWHQELGDYYTRGMNRIQKIDGDVFIASSKWTDKYFQLISYGYTKASFKEFLKRKTETKNYFEAIDDVNDVSDNIQLLYPDGSHEWSKNMNAQDSDSYANQYIQNQGNATPYDSLDKSLMLDFVAFIEEMQRQGTYVVFYLTPYHPIVYNYLKTSENHRGVELSEAWFREIAQNHCIKIYGSYDPSAMKISSDDFIDYGHMKQLSLEWYFKQNVIIE